MGSQERRRMLACQEQRLLSEGEAIAKERDDHGVLRGLKLQDSLEVACAISLEAAGKDFGGFYELRPASVVRPASVDDVALVVRQAAESPYLTVAPRGNGHSIYGQASAPGGIVLELRSMAALELLPGPVPAVRAGAGALWAEVLRFCVAHQGLAPRSWTDYLGLTVGGTLSGGGIGGQAFRFGPQTSNVLELELVTGRGDIVVCSETQNLDLFFAALGGLGQFGVITRATIPLQPAPKMVRWLRVVYNDFELYAGDAEWLVERAAEEIGWSFDYVEGFVFVNADDPVNGWGTVPLQTSQQFDGAAVGSDAVLYCLELAAFYDPDGGDSVDERAAGLLRRLRHVRGVDFRADVSYVEFLSRVDKVEEAGVWEGAYHPWLNLLISKAHIVDFDRRVFKSLLSGGVGGPMLVYPLLKTKWDPRASVALPGGEVFYLVALLRSSRPPPEGPAVEELLALNQELIDICIAHNYDFKVYLPHYRSSDQWERHFGEKWARFTEMKAAYDPLAILSPGVKIFPRAPGSAGDKDI